MATRILALFTLVSFLSITACRSAFVETTIENAGRTSLHLIEVDYPSASFGMQSLDAGAAYRYRFKIQGSGPITITWTDSANKPHTATGPNLSEGQQGSLSIVIDAEGKVSWITRLASSK
jgi:hypothetical protein